MLHLILGIAGTGKSTRLLDLLEARARAEKPAILLVPEQFSSSAEMLAYRRLGDEKSAFVEVLSFRTLAQRVLKAEGGLALPTLSEAGRVVYLRRALDTLAERLPALARHRHSAAFCRLAADTVAELKAAGAAPEILRRVAQAEEEDKYAQLALLLEGYDAVLAGSVLDPEDRLSTAAKKAMEGFFAGKACFLDNFDGFTAPEYEMLAAAVAGCDEMTAALCCDDTAETEGGLGLFSPVRHTAAQLGRLARKAGAEVRLEKLPAGGMRAAGIAAVNTLLSGGQSQAGQMDSEGVWLTQAADEWEEAALAAAQMHRLAMEGVPYARMAVICRDMAVYDAPLRRAFGLYDIPCFRDAVDTIEYTAPVAMLRAALSVLRQGLASAPLLALLKTGLCGFGEQDIAALENYVYTWSPKAADWRRPFENNPAGLLVAMGAEDSAQLAAAEDVRRRLMPAVEKFVEAARGQGAAGLSRQLYLFLDKLGAPDYLTALAAELEAGGEAEAAERLRRAWDLAMNLLDQMARLLGGQKLLPAEYDELFLLLVRATDFGQAPQMLECAVFTSADRMRLAEPEYCFVLGLCEGEFPRRAAAGGLLTPAEREKLGENGLEMAGSFENQVLREQMYLYRALTSPRRGLYLSWPQRQGGAGQSAAAEAESLAQTLRPPALELSMEQRAATPAAAFDTLAREYRSNSPQAAALWAALHQSRVPGAAERLALLGRVHNGGSFLVQDLQAVKQLAGRDLKLSATRAESWYKCRFAYCMERLLRVRPRPKAELSPLESGTYVHYLLEQVLKEAGAGFSACTDQQLAEMAARHAGAFAANFAAMATRRSNFLLAQIQAATGKLLCYLRDAAAQSDFSIDAVELEISEEPGAVPPLLVATPAGHSVRVTGKIDRVDVMRRGGKSYLCIVDYKTGHKEFSLADVYCGLDMQMLIYMLTLCRNAADRYENPVPAGILYLGADPAPARGGRQGAEARVYEMDGLLLDDPAVLKGLDRAGEGLFLPVKHRDGVAARAGARLADLEKMGAVGRHVEALLARMAAEVYGGDYAALPAVDAKKGKTPCRYCPYRAACRHEDGRHERQIEAPEDAFAPGEEGGKGA